VGRGLSRELILRRLTSRPITVECQHAPRSSSPTPRRSRPWIYCFGGKYVLTSATEPRVLTDSAVRVRTDTVAKVGDWAPRLRRAHPDARVVGKWEAVPSARPGDAHSHGRAISPIQKGVLNDYLENQPAGLGDHAALRPELNSGPRVVRHVRSGCTTIHHMGLRHRGSAGARPLRARHPHLSRRRHPPGLLAGRAQRRQARARLARLPVHPAL